MQRIRRVILLLAAAATAPLVTSAAAEGDAPANTTPPSIAGSAEVGSTLTADRGAWDGDPPNDFNYQWQHCDAGGQTCTNVVDATADTYVVGSTDVGFTLVVQVTASNASGSATAPSPITDGVPSPDNPPVNSDRPTVSGSVQVGSTLTADPGRWDGEAPNPFTYQWQDCDGTGQNCADVRHATAGTYVVTSSDIGSTLVVQATATNPAGDAAAASSPTDVVPALTPLANVTTPVVTGPAQVSATLTADPGTWTGNPPIGYAYQWRRCDTNGRSCSDVAGATGGSYQPTSSDIGWTLAVRVTATNEGSRAGAVSAATGVVAAAGYRLTPTSVSSCPATQVTVPNKDDLRSTASNTTFNATGDLWSQLSSVGDYSIWLNDENVGSGDCWIGGTIGGTNALSKTWTQLKSCCNGTAFYPWHGLSVFGVRLDNITVDDFRLLSGDRKDSYYISGSRFTGTRDDCFSTAHAALTVDDTLAECYTIVSWRNTGNSNVAFPVTLTNDLLYLKPSLVGGENKCTDQVVNGYGNGLIFKMDSFTGSTALVHVRNTIFRADFGNDMSCTLPWPTGTYSNVTVVWTGAGPFPSAVPPGVTVTTDVGVWNNAVSAWLASHPGL